MTKPKIKEFRKEIINIVATKNALFGEQETSSFRTGIRTGYGSAIAVVFPRTLLELWEVIKLCISQEKIVLMQAANTGLTGGSTPDGDNYDRDVVILNTRHLDKIQLLLVLILS